MYLYFDSQNRIISVFHNSFMYIYKCKCSKNLHDWFFKTTLDVFI